MEARRVDQRKEQVAELPLEVAFAPRLHLGLDLRKLLADLVPDILAALPVETRPRGLLAHAVGLDQRRKRARDTAQRTAPAVLLAQLERLPVLLDFGGRVGVDVAIDVRVPVYEFVAQGVGHVPEIKGALLLAQLRVEDHVQQQVAELLLDSLHVVIRDGIGQFVGLLDRIAAQRVEGLLPIPGAFAAQGVHHLQQAGRSLQTFIFHRCNACSNLVRQR